MQLYAIWHLSVVELKLFLSLSVDCGTCFCVWLAFHEHEGSFSIHSASWGMSHENHSLPNIMRGSYSYQQSNNIWAILFSASSVTSALILCCPFFFTKKKRDVGGKDMWQLGHFLISTLESRPRIKSKKKRLVIERKSPVQSSESVSVLGLQWRVHILVFRCFNPPFTIQSKPQNMGGSFFWTLQSLWPSQNSAFIASNFIPAQLASHHYF